MVWFAVFGGSALFQTHFAGNEAIMAAVNTDSALGFFAALQGFPASSLLVAVAMFSVAIFFITSSDSGTYVNGMLTSGGDPNPPLYLRITWGSLQGAIAAILLFTGGLEALQTASIVGGFPFMIIMLLMLYCLMKALFAEMREGTLPLEKQRIMDALEEIKSAR